ncbi:hypothetical protein TRIUR3_13037 [Triticum urartu]|uniref:Uncharacterized protein n=1 Tax=Triticum urartu TaxID=4572 RepID=M7ZXW1_TRIUA|nr:hypothetical protein TRIUR3_13037 [Triticum urartu]
MRTHPSVRIHICPAHYDGFVISSAFRFPGVLAFNPEVEWLFPYLSLRSRTERVVAEERGYEGGRRSGIANRFAAEWKSPTAPEPKSHGHAPTSSSLNEGSLVAKKISRHLTRIGRTIEMLRGNLLG